MNVETRQQTALFYDRQYDADGYSAAIDHQSAQVVRDFVARFRLESARILEVGCGRGFFQDMVSDWTGVDLSPNARRYIKKKFVCASADELPFEDGSFDALWSIHVLEHVVQIDRALAEICRVVSTGGLVLLKPAWFCRSWASEGYQVRPWVDFDWRGKLVKASIPVRDAVLVRLPGVAVRRLWRELAESAYRPHPLRYRKLRANFETFWQADSDACNSLDPYDIMKWFQQRGWEAVDRPGRWGRLRVRGGALVFRKP
jgi:SAM-dependent methyltransferase